MCRKLASLRGERQKPQGAPLEERRAGAAERDDGYASSENNDTVSDKQSRASIRTLSCKVFSQLPRDVNLRVRVSEHVLTRAKREAGIKAEDVREKKQEDAVFVKHCVDKIRRLRSKGKFSEINDIMATLKKKYKHGEIAQIGCVSGKLLSWLTRKPVSKATRYVTGQQQTDAVDTWCRSDSAIKLPYKRYAHNVYARTTFEQTYDRYSSEQAALGKRVLGRATVKKYLPKNFKPMHKVPYKECQCDQCVNFSLHLDALIGSGVRGIKRGFTENLKVTLCSVSDGGSDRAKYGILAYNRDCVFRKCNDCGTDQWAEHIMQFNADLDLSRMVTWHQWKRVRDHTGLSVVTKVTHRTPLWRLMFHFATQCVAMTGHLYNTHWQSQQFELCKATMPDDEVCMVMDFAQNFNHKLQDEPQAAFFGRLATTVHVHVCYYRCPVAGCECMVTEELVMLTADRKHDAHAVRTFEDIALTYLKKNSLPWRSVQEWSDNCAAQYKSKVPFDFLSRRNFAIQRNYFGAKHGKGPADGVIGRLARALTSHTRSEQVDVRHTLDMFVYCKERFATRQLHPGSCQHKRVHFFHVKRINRDTVSDALAVPGTQKQHCIRNVGVSGYVDTRLSSCFCRSCRDGSPCDESVPPFDRKNLLGPLQTAPKETKNKMWREDTRASDASHGDDDAAADMKKQQKTPAPPQPRRSARSTRSSGVVPVVTDTDSDKVKKAAKKGKKVAPKPGKVDTWVRSVSSNLPKSNAQKGASFPGWKQLLDALESCKTYLSVMDIVNTFQQLLPPVTPKEDTCNFRLDFDRRCDRSFDLIPSDVRVGGEEFFPVATSADGNCLPHCMSRWAYGHEAETDEMRVRLVFEAVDNVDVYLSNTYLLQATCLYTDDPSFKLVPVYAGWSSFGSADDDLDDIEVVLKVCKYLRHERV